MEILEEKKSKRAAANVNERRRMQNINSGFEALRDLIDVQNSAKLSKSAILRHSVDMLRNLLSENQELREQNTFMRNLYCNNYPVTNKNTPPIIHHTKSYNKSNAYDVLDTGTPHKKGKFDSDLVDYSVAASNSSYHQSSNKSPIRKYPAIIKSITSPRRATRSSVIQQNHMYTTQPRFTLESPTRRSLRLMEKDATLLTPPPSDELVPFEHEKNIFSSPTTRSRASMEQFKMNGFFTPESTRCIPVRSAKRSLDAIIHAIDQIEKS